MDQREIRVANCSLCTPSCFATGILQGGVKKAQHTTQSGLSALYYRGLNIKEKIQSLSLIYALNIVGAFPPSGLGRKLVGYSRMFVVDERRTGSNMYKG